MSQGGGRGGGWGVGRWGECFRAGESGGVCSEGDDRMSGLLTLCMGVCVWCVCVCVCVRCVCVSSFKGVLLWGVLVCGALLWGGMLFFAFLSTAAF